MRTQAVREPLEETAFDLWGTGLTTGTQPIAHVRAELDAHGALATARLPEQPNHLVFH